MNELTWSVSAGVLHVAYRSEVAKAEAHVPVVAGWKILWSSPPDPAAGLLFPGDVALGRRTLVTHYSLQIGGSYGFQIPVARSDFDAIWEAITGAPRPTALPIACPEHKWQTLRKESGRWVCEECDKEAAPKEAAHAVV